MTERAVATESGEPVDPVQAAPWGLGRTISNEEPAMRSRLVDTDGSPRPPAHWPACSAPRRRARTGCAPREDAGLPTTAMGPQRPPHGAPAHRTSVLAPTERGAIDNLRLTETEVAPFAEGYVQVRVDAARLNFRDVLNVLGLYPGDPGAIGGDAGVVTQLGDGVTGSRSGPTRLRLHAGAFASRFNVPAQFLAPIPDGISAVEAATIPAAALTVRLAFDWAQLKPGDKVLIHAASGGWPGRDPDGTAARRHRVRDGQHVRARHAAQAGREVRP